MRPRVLRASGTELRIWSANNLQKDVYVHIYLFHMFIFSLGNRPRHWVLSAIEITSVDPGKWVESTDHSAE